MARAARRRPPRLLLLVVAAGAAVLTIRRRRRRAQARDDDRPADLGFMRAIHAGLRRDAARLQALAPQLERGNGRPGAVPKGWTTFRQTLQVHHAAEDDDLWPVLRSHLTETEDLHQLDLMVAEHRSLTAAIQAVDAALASGVGVTTAARELGNVLGDHLDHEEQQVFPLLERHLSRGEWRRFLLTERRRRSARERPEFLTWVLDNASDQDTAAVLAELPRPAHLVYRRLLRPGYEAQRRWQPA
ncbi:MAG TPA: hemerythrin domain-containing protein [Actinomycetota bacterium]|nr:hemerythrin domain-containing protein [Actinomycetota bacterium]